MSKVSSVTEKPEDVLQRATASEQRVDDAVVPPPSSSYGQIFKSTALVGGSTALRMVLRVVKTKAIAVLLGPPGVGLFALFTSVTELTRTLASFGMNESGVRQIAASYGTGDAEQVAITVTALRRLSLLFACLASVILAVFSGPVTRLTFGNTNYQSDVLLLSVAVFFSTINEAQRALIQGVRRIGELAKLNVLGPLFGTLFSIPLVYFFREHGVTYAIIFTMATSLAASWWFARRVKVRRLTLGVRQICGEAGDLLKLGSVLMASWLLVLGAAYGIRVIIQHRFGIAATGYYQAAWALSEVYVGFILQAMGMDFYPRLTAACHDNAKCNRLINEQTEVGLLIAGPFLLATISLAPLVIRLFYSVKFGPAIELLRWNCLGMLLRVAIAPMSIIQLAKGRKATHFWIQFTRNVSYFAFAWIGIEFLGLLGTSVAFCGMTLVHALVNYRVARWLSDFRFAPVNRQYGSIFLGSLIVLLVGSYLLSFAVATTLGIAVTVVTGIYSLKMLSTLLPLHRMPAPARMAVRFLQMVPAFSRN